MKFVKIRDEDNKAIYRLVDNDGNAIIFDDDTKMNELLVNPKYIAAREAITGPSSNLLELKEALNAGQILVMADDTFWRETMPNEVPVE